MKARESPKGGFVATICTLHLKARRAAVGIFSLKPRSYWAQYVKIINVDASLLVHNLVNRLVAPEVIRNLNMPASEEIVDLTLSDSDAGPVQRPPKRQRAGAGARTNGTSLDPDIVVLEEASGARQPASEARKLADGEELAIVAASGEVRTQFASDRSSR